MNERASSVTETESVPVVAVGASAGGLAALEGFFRNLPERSGCAFVVLQHLSPDFRSVLGELLQGFSGLPAHTVTDRIRLREDRIYVVPPGSDVLFRDGSLHLVERITAEGLHLPIDRMLESMAHNHHGPAAAVILSGSGSDGSRGVRAVASRWSAVVVQDPSEADFDGMPRAALSTGIVRVVGPAASLARQAVNLLRESGAWLGSEFSVGPDSDDGIRRIMAQAGLQNSPYRLPMVGRRIARRMNATGCRAEHEYLRKLEEDPSEADSLQAELLIGVTSFFRDPEVFSRVEQEVVPRLFDAVSAAEEVRVWVSACATGEEAYTWAMLLDGEAERRGGRRFRIFATDADGDALRVASAAVYESQAVEAVHPERREVYFEPERGRSRVVERLRQRVVFARHDLLADPPFTRMHAVSCRNLLIYLQPPRQEQVLQNLACSLTEGGILVLGTAEGLLGEAPWFEAVDAGAKIFRRTHHARPTPQLRTGNLAWTPAPSRPSSRGPSSDSLWLALSRRYVPSGWVLDEARNLVHVFGDASKYLQLDGPATLDLAHLVPPALRGALRTAVDCALRSEEVCQVPAQAADDSRLTLSAERMEVDARSFVFVRIDPHPQLDEGDASENPPDIQNLIRTIRDLEAELQRSRERAQVGSVQLESQNDAFQAIKEQLIASNQELQSTNEELQSVNEELHSVNRQYERKNRELAELTADLSFLMDSTDIGMIFLGPNLEVRKFTPSIQRIYPLRAEDVGRPLAELSPGIQGPKEAVLSRVQVVLDEGRVLEREVQTEDGGRFLEQVHPIAPHEGSPCGVALAYVDVSAVSPQPPSPFGSEHLNRAVLEALSATIAVVDRHGIIRAVNGDWQRFGEENDASGRVRMGVGLNYLDACRTGETNLQSEDAKKARRAVLAVLSGESTREEWVYPCDSPTEARWYVMRCTPLKGPDGGAVVAHIDITELQELRRAAEEQTDELRILESAIESAAEGIYICDVHGRFRYLNSSMQRELGYADRELLGRSQSVLAYESADGSRSPEALHHEMEQTLQQGHRWTGSVRMVGKGGREVESELTLSPIASDADQVWQRVGVHRWLTEQRALEKKLMQTQKLEAIGTLAGGIAHDFNNILSAVLGYADMMQPAVTGMPEAEEDLQQIVAAAERARDLIRQILTFSRGSESSRQTLDLKELVSECAKLLRGSIPSSVVLETELPEGSVWVNADPGEIHQVIMNLVTNAYQAFGRRPGRIDLQLSEVNGSQKTAWLSVRDDGPGMAAAVRERVFEPFFTTKAEGEGTGMGLAMVHGIVQRLGGSIDLRTAVGRGTVFTIQLPTCPDPEIQEAQQAPPSTPDPSERSALIYVVDDETAVLRVCQRMLESLGFQVMGFSSPFSVLDAVEQGPAPDLLLCDNEMPELTGTELCERLRAHLPQVPFVLMTGFASPELDLTQFTAVMSKPFSKDDLGTCLDRVLFAASRRQRV